MRDQLIAQLALLLSLAVLGLLFVGPRGGTRTMALRRIAMLLLFVLAAVTIVFPDTTTWLAQAVGVGRGADLLLYGLIVVFLGHLVRSRAERTRLRAQLTLLARAQALSDSATPARKP
jgi:hypothetical protein